MFKFFISIAMLVLIYFPAQSQAQKLERFWTTTGPMKGIVYQKGLLGRIHATVQLGMTGCQISTIFRHSEKCSEDGSTLKVKLEYLQTGQCQPEIRMIKKYTFNPIRYCGKDAFVRQVLFVDDLDSQEGLEYRIY